MNKKSQPNQETQQAAENPAPQASWQPLDLLLVAGLAAALRVAALPFLLTVDNPLLNPEIFKQGDLWENLRQAREVLANGGFPDGWFIHGPLYVYLTAAALKLTGGWTAMYLAQAALGVATAALIYLVAHRWFGRAAALAAGCFAALYAPSAYYETLLTSDPVIPFFAALLLWLGGRYEGPGESESAAKRWGLPTAMGATLGALTLLRGNLALLGVGLAVWLLFGPVQRPLRRRLIALGLIAAAALTLTLPASAWNTRVAGAPRFVVGETETVWRFSWSEDATGYFRYPEPGEELLSPWSPRAWALAGKKAALFFAWFEFPDLTNFHLYSRLSPPLYYNPLTFRLLGPLALLGLMLGLHRRRRLALLYAALASVLAASVLFYISGRYRLAALPMLFPFAGHALAHAWAIARAPTPQRIKARRLGLLVMAAGALFAAVNVYDPSKIHSHWHSDAMFGNFNRDVAAGYLENGAPDRAERYARRVLWIDYLKYRIEGMSLMTEIARQRGERKTAAELEARTKRLIERWKRLPPLDQFGNRFFPPTH